MRGLEVMVTLIRLVWWAVVGLRALTVPCINDAAAQSSPPPHSGLVSVPGARLHYLDFGGSGPSLVFLAGLGNTAHVFEDFAPRFTDRFRVLALTRRGFGASVRIAGGFDTATLVEDLHAVLDSLVLGPVVLVGHSMAGDELSEFAARYPERVTALVYLDAGYDRSGGMARLGRWAAARQLPPPRPGPTGRDRASVADFAEYLARVHGVRWPRAEIIARHQVDAAGRVQGEIAAPSTYLEIVRGERRVDYGRIGAPVLAIYAVDRPIAVEYPWIGSMVVGRGAAMNQARRALQAQRAWEGEQRRRLARELSGARVVAIDGTHHYLFIAAADRVERDIRVFLAEATGPARAASGPGTPAPPPRPTAHARR